MHSRTSKLSVRVSKRQDAMLRVAATMRGTSKSAMIRECIERALTSYIHDQNEIVRRIILFREKVEIKRPANIRTLMASGRD